MRHQGANNESRFYCAKNAPNAPGLGAEPPVQGDPTTALQENGPFAQRGINGA